MNTFQEQVVVITGSTRGFGYATAQALLRVGATVVISGRSREELERALNGLRRLGTVDGLLCDVTVAEQVYGLAKKTVEQHGRLDIWINNAGYSWAAGRMIDFPPEQVQRMFLANDLGTFHGAQAALHYMLPRRQGTLVNLYGAGSFLRPASPTGPYAASKAWVTSFTRTLASELKGSGVALIGFSPGMLLTDMLTHPIVLGEAGQEIMKNYGFVLRFLARPSDKAAQKLAQTLASNRKEFIEVRLFKPWTPYLGLLRVLWENLTHSGERPEYELQIVEPYEPEF
jgi:NAD(P)-dependent dehydrogenase (short-subunit alcohol dehydrogenase family)